MSAKQLTGILSGALAALRACAALPALTALTAFVALSILVAPPSPAGADSTVPDSDHLRSFETPADETPLVTSRVTSGNAIGLAFSNNGFYGNNMVSRDPSLEYPLGSEQEHLVRAGVWIGGLLSASGSLADAETLTTTGTIDGYFGGSLATESEYFPAYTDVIERSILPNSRFYDPAHAKSEQDLICEYYDDYPNPPEQHHPLHVRVVQEILQFSFEPLDAVALVNLYIVNDHPTDPIFDLYVGVYGELASGWKGRHDEWPPTGWFRKKDIAYVDSLRLLSEHNYDNLDRGDCPSWAGIQLLGTKPQAIDTKRVSFNWWNWDPSGSLPTTPRDDAERYLVLSNGSIDATHGSEAPNNDPVTLISVGPLGTGAFADSSGVEHWIFEPGDTLQVSFAMLGGLPSPEAEPPRTAEEDIAFNAAWAQTAFNLNYNVPVPPPSPTLRVVPAHGRVTLWWEDMPLHFIDPKSRTEDFEGFRVYLSEVGKNEGFALLREFDLADSLLFDTGLDEITAPEPLVVVEESDTLTFPFRCDLTGLRDGFKYWISVTSFDRGAEDIGPLESGIAQNRVFTIPGPQREEVPDREVVVFPNPYRGDAVWDGSLARDRYIWFAGLPQRCTLRIYTLGGDLVYTLDFDADTYGATNARGIYDPDDPWAPAGDIPHLSGYMAAWDLTTRHDQAAASGLYVFSVEDKETGDVTRGRFLIMK